MLLPAAPHLGHAPGAPIIPALEGQIPFPRPDLQNQEVGGGAGAHPQIDLDSFHAQISEPFGPDSLGLAEIQIQIHRALGIDGHQVPTDLQIAAGIFG